MKRHDEEWDLIPQTTFIMASSHKGSLLTLRSPSSTSSTSSTSYSLVDIYRLASEVDEHHTQPRPLNRIDTLVDDCLLILDVTLVEILAIVSACPHASTDFERIAILAYKTLLSNITGAVSSKPTISNIGIQQNALLYTKNYIDQYMRQNSVPYNEMRIQRNTRLTTYHCYLQFQEIDPHQQYPITVNLDSVLSIHEHRVPSALVQSAARVCVRPQQDGEAVEKKTKKQKTKQ